MGSINKLAKLSMWLDHGKLQMISDTQSIITAYLQSYNNSERSVQKYESSSIEISSIQVKGSGSSLAKEFGFGEPFEVSFLVRSKEVIPDMSFLLVLHSEDGTRLATMNSTDQNLRKTLTEGALNKVTWKIDSNILTPGTYYISLSVHERYRNSLLDLEHCLSFQVKKINAPERIVIRNTNRAGYLILPGTWDIELCQ